MSFDPVTEAEVSYWHRSQGGHAGRPAAHAVRMLRECVELCVASGATELEIKMAVRRECEKASQRHEFIQSTQYSHILEEFIDVKILSMVFRTYFLNFGDIENEMFRKMSVLRQRQWTPDADGVLWRPGTGPASGHPVEPERS
jgi:hypothetical protein